MNSAERQKLVKAYLHERTWPRQTRRFDRPAHLLAVILKCGVCLALLALVVVIGTSLDKAGMPKDALGNAPHPASVAESSSVAAHRKEVFDERRARFDGNAPGEALPTHAEVAAAFAIPASRPAAAVISPPNPAKSQGVTESTCSGGADGGMDANGSQCSKEPDDLQARHWVLRDSSTPAQNLSQ